MIFVGQPASQPAVRPGCARCMAPVFSTNECYRRLQYESVVPKKIYPLRHGVSFVVLCSPFVHYEVGVTSQCMVITCYIPLSEVLFTTRKIFSRL